MKRIILIVFLLFYGLFLNSCNKEKPLPIDFRDKYIGKYQVHEKIGSYGFPECGEPFSRERDTIIGVSYGSTDSTLYVLGREVFLDSVGYYYGYHYVLRLWNDSISSYARLGGLGCGRYEIYIGYRISKKP